MPTVEKIRKYRRGKKMKIKAALIADIAATVQSNRRQTVMHCGLVRYHSHNDSPPDLGLEKKVARWVPQFCKMNRSGSSPAPPPPPPPPLQQVSFSPYLPPIGLF
jgi:hypothetical protein